jgi:hypothetical protein
MPERTDKSGRKPRVSDTDLLDVFRSTSDPVLSTREVTDEVPIKRRATLNRLQSLKDARELESKQIGGRNTVWWKPRDISEDADLAAAGAALSLDDEPAQVTTTDVLAPGITLGDNVPEHVENKNAHIAVAAAAGFVSKHAPTEKSEITAAVRPDHPLGYGPDAGDGRDRSAWWRRIIRPGLQASGFEYTNGSGWEPDAERSG